MNLKMNMTTVRCSQVNKTSTEEEVKQYLLLDLATKAIMNQPKRDYLIGKLLFNICDDPAE